MKKIIGLVMWLAAFAIPFRHAILNTKEVLVDDGRADNITGLISFVIMIALLFGGYALVYSAGTKKVEGAGHGH